MEVGDILKQRCEISSLKDASYSVSPRETKLLETEVLKGKPFSYLLGWSEFFGHRFYVNEHVLIPRPETEQLVDLIINNNKKNLKKILDVGTGSGVILLSLLHSGIASEGVGVDLSEEALKVAVINANRLRLNASFLISDRLSNIKGKFDLIVSNPPYIKKVSHRALVHDQVDKYEPSTALYLEDSIYEDWFESFFMQIYEHLEVGGTFYMEGHELELENQSKLLIKIGFKKVEVLQDFTQRSRFLKAQR